MRVDDVADVRAGDKGDTLILAVLPRDAAGWDVVRDRLTAARVAEHRVGELVAERAKAAGVSAVVFDRGGFLFHGRVKALADAAREGGLEF